MEYYNGYSSISASLPIKIDSIECGFEVQISSDWMITNSYNNYNPIPASLSSQNT